MKNHWIKQEQKIRPELNQFLKDPESYCTLDKIEYFGEFFEIIKMNYRNNERFSDLFVEDDIYFHKKLKIIRVLIMKIDRFDKNYNKNIGFNYFSTLTLGCIQQFFRKRKGYKELKENYKKYLKENTPNIVNTSVI